MRALFLLLIAGIVALGGVVVACDSGDDEQQQSQQSDQTEQADQTEQTAQSAEATGSDRATAVQRDEPADESTAQEDAQQVEPDQSEQPEADGAVTALDGPLAEATAAFEAWSADLESLVLEVKVDFSFGFASVIDSIIVAQLEPLIVWVTIDASSFFEQAMIAADEESDQSAPALLLQVLISEDAAYMSMPQIDGWIDLSGEFEEALGGMTMMLGGNPEDFADPANLGQALACFDAVGGSIATGVHEGEAVWLIDCMIDVDELNSATVALLSEQGIELADGGIETMQLSLAISQVTGAPVMIESSATLGGPFGLSDEASDDEEAPQFYVSTVSTLLRWNEPVEFPTPEPLIDRSLLDGFGESLPSNGASPGSDQRESGGPPDLLSTEELLGIATKWVAAADELNMQVVVQAVIDGEARLASTIVRGSRSQGVFETAVNIDDASSFRLLWNRDGIWTSDSEVAGQPVWAPSNPALLGFAGLTVDQFLANPNRLNLGSFKSLLGLSWLTRTIEGGGPPVYELVIETGYVSPEDPHFNDIVAILKAATAELLAESMSVESIDHYSTILTVIGDDGEVISQVMTAEFQSNAGRVELAASLNLIANGPIEFSRPMK